MGVNEESESGAGLTIWDVATLIGIDDTPDINDQLIVELSIQPIAHNRPGHVAFVATIVELCGTLQLLVPLC